MAEKGCNIKRDLYVWTPRGKVLAISIKVLLHKSEGKWVENKSIRGRYEKIWNNKCLFHDSLWMYGNIQTTENQFTVWRMNVGRDINIAFSSQWNINHIIYAIIFSILIKLKEIL